ncbi:transposase [Chromobacterium subtsugae]|uniref:Transposase n=1 Tax=Chromobacterium subtsugae TaxID=251747 RepID=A0ABS7FIP0_9NEIS|nr:MULTISPECIES: transposase [Chromobacterium]KUM04586.1 transposase [Chromobacterium subtsugae]KZE87417.1 transposase [Chromobacterium sp. F49]MBW7566558.1 transposase [Chromobacterium subtsugae]MBW8289927.1 transposase [Chromobacterium subtsugae]WSE92139.1 transposase [Chromobacterium subtsugae]
MRYRRSMAEGGTWFFTVNLADRRQDYLTRHIDVLRQVVRQVRNRHPFEIVAMVVLPDHFHAVWALPQGDADYATRMALIKAAFSRSLPKVERIRESRERKRERGIWQRRYWEHQIRDEADLQAHVDYIHYNPVKHGHAERVADWPYSSFHRYVRQGWLPADWAGEGVVVQLQE